MTSDPSNPNHRQFGLINIGLIYELASLSPPGGGLQYLNQSVCVTEAHFPHTRKRADLLSSLFASKATDKGVINKVGSTFH